MLERYAWEYCGDRFTQQFIILTIIIIVVYHTAPTDYTSEVNREITFGAGESMQCIQIAIADDRNVLEEVVETFRVTLTVTEPSVTVRFQQESILINIFEDALDG